MGKPEVPADSWAADDEDVDSGGAGVFREGPGSSGAEPLALVAKRQPGRLFEKGLQKIRERLTALQGGTVESRTELRRVLSFYHQVIFRPLAQQRGRAVSIHTEHEMATLAEGVDCLIDGDLARLGDILLQRYKALERSVEDSGAWAVAQELEVIEHAGVGLASYEEINCSARRQMQGARLQQTLLNLSQRSESAGR